MIVNYICCSTILCYLKHPSTFTLTKENSIMAAATTSKIFRSLIVGAPGSGKGTISARLVRDFELRHLASGDLLRHQIAAKTDVGTAVEGYLQKGQLVPNDLMLKLMNNELDKVRKSWLLDGFPRTIEQAKELAATQTINMVINLDVPFDVIRQRLEKRWIHEPSGRTYHMDWKPPKNPGVDDVTGEELVQREDDKPETVQQRLKLYDEMTRPLLQFYREAGVLHSFHGTESNVLYPRIKSQLDKFLKDF